MMRLLAFFTASEPDTPSAPAKTNGIVHREGMPAPRWRATLQRLAAGRCTRAALVQHIVRLENANAALQAELAALTRTAAASSHDASHDPLTGLPNRTLVKDRFGQAVARAERRGTQVVVMFLDVDRFKQVNDRFGHTLGDRVLQMVAARLQAITRATDTACRYGGDEFVIVLTDIDDAFTAPNIERKIREQLARPYRVGANAVTLHASIGCATYPQDGDAWDVLVARADAAMYRAKPLAGGP